MQIKEQLTIELTPDEAEEIIKEHLVGKGYVTNNIKFNVKHHKWTEGHGLMEIDYEETRFEGVKIEAGKFL